MQPAPHFPPFSLSRLLRTVFAPQSGEKIGILIDLLNPASVKGLKFLKDPQLLIQKYAVEVFYEGLKQGVLEELKLQGGELYAYEITGGSNLDLKDVAYDVKGKRLSLEKDIYPNYDILLCISTYSATAPLTAFAKRYGFRGATLHGVNPTILATGLSVDYEEVSRQAEKLRLGMTRADKVEIDFKVANKSYTLTLELGAQEAQKSHGLCRGKNPDVANLPAGEIYYVPTGAEGFFPMKYEDGTLGLMRVTGGRIVEVRLLHGNKTTVEEHQKKLKKDPVTGELGELGFGTQELPFAGRDIQDEKILGTFHVATGRSDHLGGHLTPDKFASSKNATHDDILFAPHKTPEIEAPQVRLYRSGAVEILIENYHPSAYLRSLLAA
jgi:hypothetical protein